MPTNFEFYKDEILEISGNKMEIAIVNNRPVPCERTDCTDCDFQCNCSECYVVQWLYAEHIEQPKLTKRERAFCEAVQKGWIYRNEGGCYWTDKTPRSDSVTVWNVVGSACGYISIYGLHFDAVKDVETVEDLLKLEVEE